MFEARKKYLKLWTIEDQNMIIFCCIDDCSFDLGNFRVHCCTKSDFEIQLYA